MRFAIACSLVVLAFGCGPDKPTRPDGPGEEPCEGLECRVVKCEQTGRPPTRITGTVYAPNGTLALYGVNVYIPLSDPGPLATGLTCDRCTDTLQGGALVHVVSDDKGNFVLENAPSGLNIPLVLQVGKWRRQITIPNVAECADNALVAADTSLPRNRLQGDIPRMAMVSGNCDELECLMRKIGVQDSEFSAEGGNGSIHLFASNGLNSVQGGATPTPLTTMTSLWGDLNKLKNYDMLFMSCECSQQASQKTQDMLNNIKMYTDMGGRVFGSHYHNIWMDGATGGGAPTAPAGWGDIASCPSETSASGAAVIDQVSNPKGAAFAQWMLNVGASSSLGTLTIEQPRQMCDTYNMQLAEQWVYAASTNKPQVLQFTAPIDRPKTERCGKVVFSDMHVSGFGSSSGTPFPDSCETGPMTPQEKALAFMIFDIASCVGVIN